jgi:hypothetical protein
MPVQHHAPAPGSRPRPDPEAALPRLGGLGRMRCTAASPQKSSALTHHHPMTASITAQPTHTAPAHHQTPPTPATAPTPRSPEHPIRLPHLMHHTRCTHTALPTHFSHPTPHSRPHQHPLPIHTPHAPIVRTLALFTSAPRSTSSPTTAWWPCWHAMYSGVAPSVVYTHPPSPRDSIHHHTTTTHTRSL